MAFCLLGSWMMLTYSQCWSCRSCTWTNWIVVWWCATQLSVLVRKVLTGLQVVKMKETAGLKVFLVFVAQTCGDVLAYCLANWCHFSLTYRPLKLTSPKYSKRRWILESEHEMAWIHDGFCWLWLPLAHARQSVVSCFALDVWDALPSAWGLLIGSDLGATYSNCT